MTRNAAWVLGAVVLCSAPAFADAPSWCKGQGDQKVNNADLSAALTSNEFDAVHDLVGELCNPDAQATSKMAELEASRARWSKRLDMNDDDWSDAAEWATRQASDRGAPTLHAAEHRAWSSLDAVEQYIALTFDIANGFDANYMADAFGAKLTESGRLGYLSWCLGRNNHEVQWAMCQPDFAAYDPHKVSTELRADKKHTGYQRFTIRLAAFRLADRLKAHAADVEKASEKDPAYAKMFEVAGEASVEWYKRWKKDAELLDLTLAMDDARQTNSRRAFAGCDDKTWAAWKSAVGGIPAKNFTGLHADLGTPIIVPALGLVANDPEGYLAGVALYTCHMDDKPETDALVRYLGEVLQRWPGYRGPRTSAMTEIMGAGLELDDRSAKIEYPSVYREWFARSSGAHGAGAGTIASMKPQGSKVHLEFATVKTKEWRCVKEQHTHRITGIRGDGSLTYEINCLKDGLVTVDHTAMPQNVNPRYAQSIKVGMPVAVIDDVVAVGWPKAGAKTPSVIAGVPVK